MLVAPLFVTVTFTTPEASAGATAVNCVAETNVTDVAAVEPNWTVELDVKLLPLIATALPPLSGPASGDRLVTAGGATIDVEVIPDPQPLLDAPLPASPP
jgi:hypothetical protein